MPLPLFALHLWCVADLASILVLWLSDFTGDGKDFNRRWRRGAGVHWHLWLCCRVVSNVFWPYFPIGAWVLVLFIVICRKWPSQIDLLILVVKILVKNGPLDSRWKVVESQASKLPGSLDCHPEDMPWSWVRCRMRTELKKLSWPDLPG